MGPPQLRCSSQAASSQQQPNTSDMLEMPKDVCLSTLSTKETKRTICSPTLGTCWEHCTTHSKDHPHPAWSVLAAMSYLQLPAALQSTSTIARPQVPGEGAGTQLWRPSFWWLCWANHCYSQTAGCRWSGERGPFLWRVCHCRKCFVTSTLSARAGWSGCCQKAVGMSLEVYAQW